MHATTTTIAATRQIGPCLVHGTAYLLVTETDGLEMVVQYSAADVAELFSEAELAAFGQGRDVVRHGRDGGIRWIDMIAATRDAA